MIGKQETKHCTGDSQRSSTVRCIDESVIVSIHYLDEGKVASHETALGITICGSQCFPEQFL